MELAAYQGVCFEIEWYVDHRQQSPARNYYYSLTADERIQVLKLFKRIGDGGVIKDKTKFVSEGDKIYAFKPKPDRFLCFFCEGKKIVVTNGFRKKQQKMPKSEKTKAIRMRDDYLLRMKVGEYYERDRTVDI